jgi:hypothetical protein
MSVAVGMAQPRAAPGDAPGDRQVQQCRDDDAPERGDDREGGGLAVRELANRQLPLILEPSDVEEDGQQPVRGPLLGREVGAEGRRVEVELPQVLVGLGERAVRRREGKSGATSRTRPPTFSTRR